MLRYILIANYWCAVKDHWDGTHTPEDVSLNERDTSVDTLCLFSDDVTSLRTLRSGIRV